MLGNRFVHAAPRVLLSAGFAVCLPPCWLAVAHAQSDPEPQEVPEAKLVEPSGPAPRVVDVTASSTSRVERKRESAEAVKVVELVRAKQESVDLAEVLARTPGISVQREGGLGSGMRFTLHGLSGNQIRFFLDGVPLDFTLYALGIENTPAVIERYRAATISLDYYGDSILNSLGDIAAMAFGFWLAARLPVWSSIGAVVAVEVTLAFLIRDNLTLNILMLLHPIDAIRQWQLGA